MKYDYLIVGAGLYGSTFAYIMKQAGKKCLVIDKRTHIGGNTFCKNESGIHVHQYGAHIFHTNDKKIWDFVNGFVDFIPFINSPKAKYYNEVYNMPFNMNTFGQLWGVKTPDEAREKIASQTAPYLHIKPLNLKDQALALVGPDIFEKLIKHYTEKQWGRPCEELPGFLIKRIPLRFTYDNNYFNDTYQGIPKGGYNTLTSALLNDIEVRLNVDFMHEPELVSDAANIVYSGKIDAYFNYCYGELEYRSLRFEHIFMEGVKDFQHNAVFNYTSPDVPYTRVVEHKHFEWKDDLDHTVVSYEYPHQYIKGAEAYYPVNNERNNRIYSQYKKLAEQQANVIFGGRLAEYRYYDMHQVIAAAIHDAQKKLQL